MEEPAPTRGTRVRRALSRALRPLPGPPTRAAALGDAALGAVAALLFLGEVALLALAGEFGAGEAVARGAVGTAVVAAVAVLARRHPPAALVVAAAGAFWSFTGGLLLACVSYLAGRR
ncbi:two-component sensor histidine kinase, partial [Nocardiopsis sp. frass3]